IERGVMISAGTVFTNDRFPRACTNDLLHLRPSEPDDETLATLVREGATIGANCTIGCGLEIGRFAMVGMGSVVTKTVPDFHLVVGSPARSVSCVCRCGHLLARFAELEAGATARLTCRVCGDGYDVREGVVAPLATVP
ncbi:MAG: N-acetyltransferase, partial [bacterium]|nr:N-acetyltransferase [bacterium]